MFKRWILGLAILCVGCAGHFGHGLSTQHVDYARNFSKSGLWLYPIPDEGQKIEEHKGVYFSSKTPGGGFGVNFVSGVLVNEGTTTVAYSIQNVTYNPITLATMKITVKDATGNVLPSINQNDRAGYPDIPVKEIISGIEVFEGKPAAYPLTVEWTFPNRHSVSLKYQVTEPI